MAFGDFYQHEKLLTLQRLTVEKKIVSWPELNLVFTQLSSPKMLLCTSAQSSGLQRSWSALTLQPRHKVLVLLTCLVYSDLISHIALFPSRRLCWRGGGAVLRLQEVWWVCAVASRTTIAGLYDAPVMSSLQMIAWRIFFFTNSVGLGSYPATAVLRVKRPHLISQKAHLLLAAAFTFPPAAVGHSAEGNHSILGVPDRDLASPPACQRPFVWLGLKPKKSVAQRVQPPPAPRTFLKPFHTGLKSRLHIRHINHYRRPDVGQSQCETFKNVTQAHSKRFKLVSWQISAEISPNFVNTGSQINFPCVTVNRRM